MKENHLKPKQLLISGLVCLVLAVAVVVLFVLPAEYGQDKVGFGEATGLTKLAKTDAEITTKPLIKDTFGETISEASNISDSHYQFIDPDTAEVFYDVWSDPEPVLLGNNHQEQATGFKTETIQIILDQDGTTEYKAIMNEGDSLVYSWVADQDLYADFHAHLDTGNPDFFTRYSEKEGREDHGSIVAPYSGQHGWYWLNLGEGKTTIELRVSGFYTELIKIDLDSKSE